MHEIIDIETRVKKVMATVFNVDPKHISPEASLDNFEKWTSLGHMNLVIALEEEFSIQFNDQQVLEMMSFPLILCILKEIGINP